MNLNRPLSLLIIYYMEVSVSSITFRTKVVQKGRYKMLLKSHSLWQLFLLLSTNLLHIISRTKPLWHLFLLVPTNLYHIFSLEVNVLLDNQSLQRLLCLRINGLSSCVLDPDVRPSAACSSMIPSWLQGVHSMTKHELFTFSKEDSIWLY